MEWEEKKNPVDAPSRKSRSLFERPAGQLADPVILCVPLPIGPSVGRAGGEPSRCCPIGNGSMTAELGTRGKVGTQKRLLEEGCSPWYRGEREGQGVGEGHQKGENNRRTRDHCDIE